MKVSLDQKTLKHIVDALAAAKACGLTSDIEQVVFDHSIINAGGIIRLAKLAGMIEKDRQEDKKPCESSPY